MDLVKIRQLLEQVGLPRRYVPPAERADRCAQLGIDPPQRAEWEEDRDHAECEVLNAIPSLLAEIRRLQDEAESDAEQANEQRKRIDWLAAECERLRLQLARLMESCDPLNGNTPQWCSECGAPVIAVRPGKVQCDRCDEMARLRVERLRKKMRDRRNAQ